MDQRIQLREVLRKNIIYPGVGFDSLEEGECFSIMGSSKCQDGITDLHTIHMYIFIDKQLNINKASAPKLWCGHVRLGVPDPESLGIQERSS